MLHLCKIFQPLETPTIKGLERFVFFELRGI